MKPNVLFIVLPYVVHNIDFTRPKIRSYFAFPYGLLSVATYCKDLANIHIIDCDADPNYHESIDTLLRWFRPDIVGFSMMFDNSYAYLADLVGRIKDYDPNILTVLGGAAASYSYQEILDEQDDIDAVCYGEGEIPFRDLLSDMIADIYNYLDEHPAWVTRESIKRGQAPVISYIENLDDVISIDYSFINSAVYDMQEAFSPFVDHQKHKQFFISTSRGCPFKCAFCSNGKIHGKKMRFASVDRIIEHVGYLVQEYGMDVLTIYDDQLLIDMERAKDLFDQLADFNLRIECPNGLSVRYIDDEMALLMKSAGVDTVYLAIEHGSERVLRDCIHKPLTLSMVKPAVDALREYGFFIHGFFVIGMPGETKEDRDETVRFIKEIGLDWAGFNPATPVRGSELYDQCIKEGWITKQRIGETVDKKYIINAPEIGLTPEIIEAEVDRMNLDVNFHNNQRMQIGDYKTAARCFIEVLKRYGEHKWAKHYLRMCIKHEATL